MKRLITACVLVALAAFVAGNHVGAQPEPKQKEKDGRPQFGGPGGGPGGPGGPMGQHREVVKQFDKDGDGRLNKEERTAAREFLKKDGGGRRGGFGPPGGFGKGNQQPPKPGPHIGPSDVKNFPDAPLYDAQVLRTIFVDFEDQDWEAEMADFYHTDVEVPATLTVDGKKYPNVGMRFRGASSYFTVGAGYKRSLNINVDYADAKQRLYGAKTLNLLNSHDDPTFMSSMLYSYVSRQHIPCPKVNYVKVVINGESWGVYVNEQQFNKEFLAENYKTTKGARWKVQGSPGGGGGLEYIGDNVADYKRRYSIKSNDDPKCWKALINLCKVLNQTPPDKLEEALKPIVDIDNLLWFLALDAALINCDGYWIRASDYSIYLDEKNLFHFIPHDMNECFRPGQGPGMGGGPGGGNMVFRMGRPGEVIPGFLMDQLRLNDDQKKQLAELQKDVDAKIEKILTDEQRQQLRSPPRDQFGPPGGGGFGGPPGGGGGPPGGGQPGGGRGGQRGNPIEIDPLIGLDDQRKPLRSKVLAVPALRTRYLQHIHTIAAESLDWKKLGPTVAQYRALIEKDVEADTRKIDSFAEFKELTANEPSGGRGPGRGPTMSLRTFAEQRRQYLVNHPEVTKAIGAGSKSSGAR